jgi:hypothetical protein
MGSFEMYMSESAMEFRRRHFLVFIVSIFLGMISCAFVLVLAIGTYFERSDLNLVSRWMFAVILISSALQTFFYFRILRGYTRWVGGMVFLFTSCFFISAPAITYDPDFGLYAIALSLPLLGLYCLNSERYRAMLEAAKRSRLERTGGRQPKLKTSRRQMAINNGLRAKSKKPFVREEVGTTIIKWIFWALTIFFIFGVVVKLFLIYEGLVTGVVVSASRYGSPKSYSFADDPWMFGISMLLHLLVIGVCGLFLKLMLLLRE